MEIYKVMTIRKIILFLGLSTVFISFLLIYLMHDESIFPEGGNSKFSINDNQWLHFESRLAKLENDFIKHQERMYIEGTSQSKSDLTVNAVKYRKHPKDISIITLEKPAQCNIDVNKTPIVDIQMLNIYKKLEFDNPDGGAWKQGWDIKYDEKQWHPNRKLKVFVVPHSHNDPGWLNTFEKYYTFQTQNILNNMASKLSEDKKRKFIWAEISFFQLWWDKQSQSVRDTVKQLIHDGQLEIVAGGWVMPDESVSHWMAQLTQLTEGHQWLKQNLDYTPSNGWAIDPFGLSPTMPYLLKKSGLKHLVIQRVHYSVKKYLAKQKSLEFRWRQLWDNAGSTELFTHMMPFYSYDVPHTCGPDPKVCCQFDFFRLLSFGVTCHSWKVPPRVIANNNVASRAMLLLDQYRKKAQLFKTNVLLVPLGDDFRYIHSSEWNAQFGNYQKLFDYMNDNQQLNVQIQFGTLQDYFEALESVQNSKNFPVLSGDFFTYADRDDHYWSGYYTSRPFHKRLDRVLLSSLRGSEVLSSIAWIYGNHQVTEGSLATKMSIARRWHSLFQHHDGVTGTARDNVMNDYAQKMIVALNNSAHVLQQSIIHLLRTSRTTLIDLKATYLSLDEIRSHHTSTGERYLLTLGADSLSHKVILYNSLPRQRTKVQSLFTSTPFVRVTNSTGHSVKCQISPVWVGPGTLSSTRYELSFLVSVPALGLTTYVIHILPENHNSPDVHFSNVTVYNISTPPQKIPGFNHINTSPFQEFSISYGLEFAAAFGKSGLLKAIRTSKTTVPVHLSFKKYGTSQSRDKSGAYLFLPDKSKPDSISLHNDRIVHVITGPLISKVYIDLPYVRHTCVIYNSTGIDGESLHIFNEVDITETNNFELVMRFETDIQSGDLFYTDLNGLNMIKRQRFSKIPLQGNYYPMAAAGYIEDNQHRLTVLTGQPLGISSLASGQLEIMQDRRLNQDDNRGLGQGVLDNLLTIHKFSLIVEKKMPCKIQIESDEHPAGLLSLIGYLTLEELLHPFVALHPREIEPTIEMNAILSPLRMDFPVDISLVNMRIFPIPEGAGKGIGLTLHRNVFDYCWGNRDTLNHFTLSNNGQLDLKSLLNSDSNWIISDSPLTFHSVGATRNSSIIYLCPHEITSILIHKHAVQINF